MPLTQVGNELQEVDFGELVRSIAQGIADGQRALDVASIKTMQVLANTTVDVIPEVSEVIVPAPFRVNIPDASGVPGSSGVMVTGARVWASAAEPVKMTALQAGLLPTFYQFTEATIQAKVSIQLREAQQTETDGSTKGGIFAFASNVNFRTQNTFSYSVDASASVSVIMRPVPPNVRLQPSVITVNTLGGGKPVVTINP
jgi:hypothetical protein